MEKLLFNVLNTVISLCKIPVLSDLRLITWYPKKNSRGVLILGNGPSLNESISKIGDLETIKQFADIVCVNLFASSSSYEMIRPQKYFILDPLFINGSNERCVQLLRDLAGKTTWQLELIVPKSFRRSGVLQEALQHNPFITITYFNYTIIKGFKWIENLTYAIGIGAPVCQNVLVGAVYMALYSGYKKVAIIGGEHSWHENLRVSDEDNSLILNDQHFYGERKRVLSEEFYTKGENLLPHSALADQLMSYYKVFSTHERLAIWALERGITIVNASEHSNIDVYKRLNSSQLQDFFQ